MPRKPIELPAEVARRFVEDMRAFFAEPNAIKRDEIAARQLLYANVWKTLGSEPLEGSRYGVVVLRETIRCGRNRSTECGS